MCFNHELVGLDMDRGNPLRRVRARCKFGQRKTETDLEPLRTQKAKIQGPESEPGATSDTKSEKQGV